MRNDQELIEYTKSKVGEERAIGVEILHLIHEIWERRLHIKRSYNSLHELCVKELKYTDGCAHRRIKAMQLMYALPEVEEKLIQGSLNLSTAASLQNYCNQADIRDPAAQRELVEKIENKTTREAEAIIQEASGKPKTRKIEVDAETFDLLIELKNFLSHDPECKSIAGVVKKMTCEELRRQKLKRFGKDGGKVNQTESATTRSQSAAAPSQDVPAPISKSLRASAQKLRTRHIPNPIRRAVFLRDQCCTYVDPETRRRCGSFWQLELDHIRPFAVGGAHVLENLRLLCDVHNRERTRGSGEPLDLSKHRF